MYKRKQMKKLASMTAVLLIAGFAHAQPAAPIVKAIATDELVVQETASESVAVETMVEEMAVEEVSASE